MDWLSSIVNGISSLIAIGAFHYEIIAIAAAVGFPVSIWAVFRYRHTPAWLRITVILLLFIVVAGLLMLEVLRNGL